MDAKLNYSVTIHEEDGSYWAEVDELPGCFASGDSMEEVWEALAEAMGLYLSTPESEAHVKVTKREVVSHSTETKILVEC